MGRCRAVPLILAVTWLPYTATRCIANPATHAGCGALATAAAQTDSEGHLARAHRHGVTPAHHHHGGNGLPVHTCCELTCKCDINLTSAAASVDPPALVITVPAVAYATIPGDTELSRRPSIALTHGPPLYLRHITLLI